MTPAANPLKRFFQWLGPGLITDASDDDPSGIGTYATAGATLGYAMFWTAIVTLPLMVVVQFLCAKVGLVRGHGFYAVIAVSTLIGSGINFLGINPITALFWAAVINGLLTPPLLVVLMLITNNPQIMGAQVNGRLTQSLGWLPAILMLAAAIGLMMTSG